MNPLFASQPQPSQPAPQSLPELMRRYTPQQAREEVERICAERGITGEALRSYVDQARSLMSLFGVR